MQLPPRPIGILLFVTQLLCCEEVQETLWKGPCEKEQRPPTDSPAELPASSQHMLPDVNEPSWPIFDDTMWIREKLSLVDPTQIANICEEFILVNNCYCFMLTSFRAICYVAIATWKGKKGRKEKQINASSLTRR